ncbi:GNAT family N-acetyltransferase [Paractinoplanes lichenicola]|uniref:GNAT family N-acetyltransferase n=1 Tax=Paractinoplanes lichenicola TaxID=2802976 RepID=A0ABS1VZ24_9ACTN|nr:GNAT family N-acetyltransferase [Actinoplanes lichenicola]MBL7259705.1 GNAT family N-acetyltransferase [Actinoplanes lichenicola]
MAAVWVSGEMDAMFSLRPATLDDAVTLAEIVMAATKHQGRWPAMTPADEQEWRTGFADWSRQTLADVSVIVEGGEAIGRLRVVRGDGFLRLAGIQLLPSAQGRGIGTAIVRQLQSRARRESVPLLIGVEKDNPRARQLYERLGCVPVGENEAGDEVELRWSGSGVQGP